jgi:transglutaminase-like putative cysteine protease
MTTEKEIAGSSIEATAPDIPRSARNAFRKAFRRYFPLILILWILFVLYPNPLKLPVSIHRFLNPNVDPVAVQPFLDDFPSDPVAIEQAVLARIRYGLDWELYGMPWYFPTVEETLERGQGDCKARALVLASVLKAKDISSQVVSSPTHVWVDYEGKEQTSIENTQVQFYQLDPETGERRFQIPQIRLSQLMNGWRAQLWTPMPTDRRVLLFTGLLGLVAARVVFFNKRLLRATARKHSG